MFRMDRSELELWLVHLAKMGGWHVISYRHAVRCFMLDQSVRCDGDNSNPSLQEQQGSAHGHGAVRCGAVRCSLSPCRTKPRGNQQRS